MWKDIQPCGHPKQTSFRKVSVRNLVVSQQQILD